MQRLLLVHIILLAIWASGAAAQVKETVINDNFASNTAGWPEDRTTDFISKIEGGVYHLVHSRVYGSKCFDIPVKMYLGDNYFIETQGKLLSGDRRNGYGIVWGKGKGGYFTFVITAEGQFYVRKVYTGKQGEYLLGPYSSKFIHKGGITNKIRVQLSNDELQFFANGHYIGHLPNEQYFGNNAGIVLYGRQTVEIDNFGAYGTRNYERLPNYSAQMKVSYYEIEDGNSDTGDKLGNGDCRVNPGETVMLAVTLKNNGYGVCDNLNATFYAISDYVTILDKDIRQTIRSVGRFQTAVLNLKFRVSPGCSIDKLNFKIDITDNDGRLAETVPMQVPINTRIPPINKDDQGKISFTFNVKETNSDDINTFYPITLQNSQQTIAAVIGVETYQKLPKALYASNDAKIFFNYLVKVANVPRSNIVYLANQNATLERVSDIFKPGGELNSKTGRETLILYFSGLGYCEHGKTIPYIMLHNSTEDDPTGTGLSVQAILNYIRAIGPRQVICIFETSFAGVDREGKPFGQRGGTVWTGSSFPYISDQNTCMIYASGGGYTNPVVERSSHGMLTHYLLTAMQQYGKNSTTLNMKDLYDYILQGMDREATARGIKVFPRMDCVNKDGIKLLK